MEDQDMTYPPHYDHYDIIKNLDHGSGSGMQAFTSPLKSNN